MQVSALVLGIRCNCQPQSLKYYTAAVPVYPSEAKLFSILVSACQFPPSAPMLLANLMKTCKCTETHELQNKSEVRCELLMDTRHSNRLDLDLAGLFTLSGTCARMCFNIHTTCMSQVVNAVRIDPVMRNLFTSSNLAFATPQSSTVNSCCC